MAIGLALTLSAIALAAILLHRLQLRALAPVFELSNLAERVALQYDYGLRARARGDDEMGRLAQCFNEMLERIEAREKALNAEIGERLAVEQKLDRLAHYDSLTQLPNRHLFQKELQRIVDETVVGKQLAALMFIDLDNFKYANDAAGHDAGDLLLKVVAKRLSAVLRNSDTLCRLGGDEFAAILPQPVSYTHLFEGLTFGQRFLGQQLLKNGVLSGFAEHSDIHQSDGQRPARLDAVAGFPTAGGLVQGAFDLGFVIAERLQRFLNVALGVGVQPLQLGFDRRGFAVEAVDVEMPQDLSLIHI